MRHESRPDQRGTGERLRQSADSQCGYCLSRQEYVLGPLEIDHIIPVTKGGGDDKDNLWLACRLCNNVKGTQTDARDWLSGQMVALFNPRNQEWSDHFRWSEDGTQIERVTACG